MSYVEGFFISALVNPQGCILHGSRSGQDYNKLEEYNSTVNFVRDGAYDAEGTPLGWNVTIGEDRYSIHNRKRWGWNAGKHSRDFVAAEFAQAKVGEPITDAQLDMFEHWWRSVVMVDYPNIPMFFINHSELEQGIAAGKTDAGRIGAEANMLRERIMERLAA